MEREIQPARRVAGTISLPGDKSISHRYALLAALAEGRSTIANYAGGADCASTLGCLGALGVRYRRDGAAVTIDGVGLEGLRPAAGPLDAGNSGTTMRLLSGILAGQPFETAIGGDASLSRRPMQRIIRPLERMGATIRAREGGSPAAGRARRGAAADPLRVAGGERASQDGGAVRGPVRRRRNDRGRAPRRRATIPKSRCGNSAPR